MLIALGALACLACALHGEAPLISPGIGNGLNGVAESAGTSPRSPVEVVGPTSFDGLEERTAAFSLPGAYPSAVRPDTPFPSADRSIDSLAGSSRPELLPQYDSRSQRPDSASRRGPAIPEPMVFDLVRPLGAAVGEVEVNTLGQINSKNTAFAPEIEAVIARNFAVEAELPIEDGTVESYKFAAQYTLGTARDDTLIHGLQTIYEYQRHSEVNEATLLHITGMRFDEKLSALWMLGGRAHLGGDHDDARTDVLANGSLFYDAGKHVVLGLETNLAQPLGSGRVEFLLMPQVHVGVSNNLHVQAGYGLLEADGTSRGQAAFRVIWSF